MPPVGGGRSITFAAAASNAPVVAPGTGGQSSLSDVNVEAHLHVSAQLSPAVMQKLCHLAGVSFF